MPAPADRPDRDTPPVGGRPTLRQRRREATAAEILDVASRLLAEHGATALTLRSVAQEMGMAVSALYRYVDGRDGLLTLLLLDAFSGIGRAVGEAVDAALARPGPDPARAWGDAARAYRRWALAHPAAFALAHGAPVPGYAAPETTVGPGTAVQRHLVRLLVAAAPRLPGPTLHAMDAALPDLVRQDARAARGRLGEPVGTALPDGLLAAGLQAWLTLQGAVTAEVFGQLEPVLDHPGAWFDHLVDDHVRRMHLHEADTDAR